VKGASSPLHVIATTLFLLLAFLAPGAWLITAIPAVEKAQLCFLLATLVCAALVCARLVPLRRPVRGALLAAGLVTLAFLLALVTNVFPVQQLFYDLYGEMPGYVWLCYPVIFLLAASLGLGSWLRPALRVVTLVGFLLILVALYQRFFTPWINVFGSAAYNVSAFIPLPVLALWLATGETRRRAVWAWRISALLAALAIAVISYGMLGIFAALGLVLLTAALRPQLFGLTTHRLRRAVRIGGGALLAALVLALCIALLPPLSSLVVKRADIAHLGSTVGTRMEFSYGAQAMTLKRPLTGYGPSGYRMSAYRFLDKWIYGDTSSIGSDPIAYSPPSPHSLPWEVTTRLGLVGLLALLGAGWFWLRAAGFAFGARRRGEARTSARSSQHADADALPARSPQDARADAPSDDPPPGDSADFRAACAIAALAWLLSLFVTPMHFASGLLGAALAGLACARPVATGMDALRLPSAGKTVARVAGLLVLLAVAVFFTRQQLALAPVSEIISNPVDAQTLTLLQGAAKTAPGDPLIERYILECRLLLASNAQDLARQLQAVRAAPGYLANYGPNATRFAQIALDQTQSFQAGSAGAGDATSVAAVKLLLRQAAQAGPVTPALLGERLHLALVSGDRAALRQATATLRQTRFNGKTAQELYAPLTEYLAQAGVK